MIQFAGMKQQPIRFADDSHAAAACLKRLIRSAPRPRSGVRCLLRPMANPYQESETNMPTLSPTLIGTFFVSITLQVAALSLLPITQGFSRPLPTIALIVLFIAGIGLLARIIATGMPLSILLPVSFFCGRPARRPRRRSDVLWRACIAAASCPADCGMWADRGGNHHKIEERRSSMILSLVGSKLGSLYLYRNEWI